jgi:hypothetical protein
LRLRGIGFGFRRGVGVGLFGGRGGGEAFGLEAFEVTQSAVPVALGRIGAALEDREVFAGANEIHALGVGALAHVHAIGVVIPDLGVGERIAAEEPVGVDEGGDEERLFGSGGFPAEEVAVGKGTEFGGVFAGDDLGSGVEAGLEGIGTGGGLALGGAGACGTLRVAAVGGGLFGGAHLSGIAGWGAGV